MIEAERAADCFVVQTQIRNGNRHVQADLKNELWLLLEPGRDDVRLLPRIEMNVDARPFEQGEGDILLRR